MASTRDRIVEAILRISKTRRITDIGVTDLAAEAGISRQAFYYHFIDINDTICYTGIHLTTTKDIPPTDIEAVRYCTRVSLRHKEFFRQLPFMTGQNNYRDTLFEWTYRAFWRAFVEPLTDMTKRKKRELQVRYSVHGGNDLLLDWYASGLQWPPDDVVEAIESRRTDYHDPQALSRSPAAPRKGHLED